MAKLLKLRRGTTTQHGSFTGAEGEVTIDTTKDTAVVHDGSTQAGRPLAREDMNNVPAGTILGTQLENSGVTAGAYGSSSAIPIVTVDAQGLVTAASTTAIDSTTIANGSSSVSVANNGAITSNANHDFSAGIDVTGAINATTDIKTTGGSFKLDTNFLIDEVSSAASGAESPDGSTLIFNGAIGKDIHIGSYGDVVFGSNNATTHSVAKFQMSRLGASVHGKSILNYVTANAGGSTSSATKLTTESTGINVTGDIAVTGTVDGVDIAALNTTAMNKTGDTITGDCTIASGVTNKNIDIDINGTSTLIRFDDDLKATFGDSDDLQIYHDGSDSYIKDAGTGKLRLLTDSFRVSNAADSENIITAEENGAVSLFYDNSKKFETTSSGVTISGGTVANGHITLPDHTASQDGLLRFGATGDDLQIYHDGTDSRIHNVTGSLIFRTGTNYTFYNSDASKKHCQFLENGAVELYHNNSKKLETTSTGVSVTGALVASDNVTAYSDQKLKTDISTINDALGIVGKLRGVSYKWLADGSDAIGVIAQEVEEVLPEVVVTNNGVNPNTQEIEEIKSVDYGKIVGVLINAINELKAELDEHKKGGK